MPKAAAMHYVYVCHSCKSRSWTVEKLRMQLLPHICHSAKYERSIAQVIGVLEPENRKVGQGVLTFFANVKVTCVIYHVGPFQAV